MQVGSVLFRGRLPVKNYDQYGLDADEDEGVPLPPAPKDGNVSGKPRSFLEYAPSWAKHPDYDRVGGHASGNGMRTFFQGLWFHAVRAYPDWVAFTSTCPMAV